MAPADPLEALAREAAALVVEQRYAEAEPLYQRLRELAGDSAELLNNHAVVCGALGELERKLELLQQAVAVDPSHRCARFIRAFALLEADRDQEALAATCAAVRRTGLG